MKYKSYLDELNRKEKLEEEKIERLIKVHKCYRCVWGSWQGAKCYCMLPRCLKLLSEFDEGFL